MPPRQRQPGLKLGDRARKKLNRRVGTVDAVDGTSDQQQYGLHYDEAPQDKHLASRHCDSAQLPPELIERE